MEVKDDKRYDCRQSTEAARAVLGSDADREHIPTSIQLSGHNHHRQDVGVCVNLFYAKFRNLTCTAYLEMF